MTTQTEVLNLALEALDGLYMPNELERVNKAIIAIKEYLAQQSNEQVEPVAFICQGNAYMADDVDEYCTAKHIPLYTKEQL